MENEIKQTMMIVGLKAIENNLMELELTQLLHKQKKVSMLQLAKMDAVEATQLVKGTAYHRDKIHVSRQWCSDNAIMPFSAITLTIKATSQQEKDEIKGKFK